jgi:short-subunit dehydrogenase
MTVDVTKGDQILKALAHVVDHNSQIDILVNNAGYLGSYQPFEQSIPASAGIIAFTKALSREVCDTDIRVNCIAPGPIDTELIRRLGHEVVEAMISASPLQRLGSVDEVAGLVYGFAPLPVRLIRGRIRHVWRSGAILRVREETFRWLPLQMFWSESCWTAGMSRHLQLRIRTRPSTWLRCGTGSTVRMFMWPRRREVEKLETCNPTQRSP